MNSGEQLFLLITVIKNLQTWQRSFTQMSPQYTLATPPPVLLRHYYFYHCSVSNRHLLIASQGKLMNQSMNVLETELLKEILSQKELVAFFDLEVNLLFGKY